MNYLKFNFNLNFNSKYFDLILKKSNILFWHFFLIFSVILIISLNSIFFNLFSLLILLFLIHDSSQRIRHLKLFLDSLDKFRRFFLVNSSKKPFLARISYFKSVKNQLWSYWTPSPAAWRPPWFSGCDTSETRIHRSHWR